MIDIKETRESIVANLIRSLVEQLNQYIDEAELLNIDVDMHTNNGANNKITINSITTRIDL